MNLLFVLEEVVEDDLPPLTSAGTDDDVEIVYELPPRVDDEYSNATTEFIECDTLPQFASAILNQISVLLAIETSDIICCAITRDVKSSNQYKILATNLQGKSLSTIPAKVQTRIEEALNQHSNIQGNDYFVSYFTTRRGMENVLYVAIKAPGLKRKFVNTSLRNVAKNLIPDWLICYWLTLPLSPPFAANSPTRNKLCGVCRKLIR